MPEIHKVAILGAGAVGGYYASRFLDTPQFSTVVVARGERYDRLTSNGLVLNGRRVAIPVAHPDDAASPADLILIALKHHHLRRALPDLANLVGPRTTIISLMNGLDSEEIIGSVHGKEKTLYAISVGIDAVRQENRITYTRPGKVYFGEAVNTQLSQRVQRLQEAFDRAGIAHETVEDMIRMLWWKFMVNVGVNQASAVMRAPYGAFQSSPAAQALMEELMREVVALAGHAGVNLVEQDIADWYEALNTLSPQGQTSMLQDIEAGRKTEVDIFGGKVVEMGQAYGVPTPANQTVLRIIQVLEGGG